MSTAAIETVPAHESPMRKWGSLLVLSLALAIIIIDTTLLNVSLSTLIRELHTTLQSLQWVISAYSLTLAALTVTGGRMGDLFGRKRMFMTGAVLFAIGSFIASISSSVPQLLIGESLVEGLGAALMMPSTASLLVAKYRGRDRALAFGVWGGIAAAASAIGPILGGFLTTHYSWRWGFRINIGVVALLLLGSVILEDRNETQGKSIDWPGVLLSSSGLFLIVFGIIESSSYGWLLARKSFPVIQPGPLSIVPVAILLGIVTLVWFAWWEGRVEASGKPPIVSMSLFRNRQFVAGAAVIGTLMLGQNGIIFSLPVFLQGVRNLDAFHTGLALLPMSITLLIVSPGAAALSRWIPPSRLVQCGLGVVVVALLVLRHSLTIDMPTSALIPGLTLYGIGMGLVMSQVNNITLSAVPVREAGEASGVSNTFRQVGSSLGAAIIGAVLIATILTEIEGGLLSSSSIPSASRKSIASAIEAQPSGLAFGSGDLFARLSPEAAAEMNRLRREATTTGNRKALLYGAIFAVFGFLISFRLPKEAGERR